MSDLEDQSVSRWRTPAEIRQLIDATVAGARQTERNGEDPWPTFERAHLLSQPWPWPHTRVHASMLSTAMRRGEGREVVGQIVRLVVAGPGSLAGRYPPGNTGRTTMALTETADVPDDVARILHRFARRSVDRRRGPLRRRPGGNRPS